MASTRSTRGPSPARSRGTTPRTRGVTAAHVVVHNHKENALPNYQKELTALTQELERKTDTIDRLKEELALAQEKAINAQTRTEAARIRHAELVADLDEERKARRKLLQTLHERERYAHEADELRRAEAKRGEEFEKFAEETRANAEAKIKVAQAAQEFAERNLDDIRKDNDLVHHQLEELGRELTASDVRADQAIQAEQTASREIARLQDALRAARKGRESDVATQARQVSQLQGQVADLESKLKERAREAKRGLELHQRRQSNLQEQREADRHEADGEIQALFAQNQEMREELNAAKRAMAAMGKKEQVTRQQTAKVIEEVEALRDKLRQADDKSRAAQHDTTMRIAHERAERIKAEEKVAKLEKALRLSRQSQAAGESRLRDTESHLNSLRLRVAAAEASSHELATETTATSPYRPQSPMTLSPSRSMAAPTSPEVSGARIDGGDRAPLPQSLQMTVEFQRGYIRQRELLLKQSAGPSSTHNSPIASPLRSARGVSPSRTSTSSTNSPHRRAWESPTRTLDESGHNRHL